jgi:sugar lactone lactonase YvrE
MGLLGRWHGMAVTPDNATLIVAETAGAQLTAFDIARSPAMAVCHKVSN